MTLFRPDRFYKITAEYEWWIDFRIELTSADEAVVIRESDGRRMMPRCTLAEALSWCEKCAILEENASPGPTQKSSDADENEPRRLEEPIGLGILRAMANLLRRIGNHIVIHSRRYVVLDIGRHRVTVCSEASHEVDEFDLDDLANAPEPE